MTSSLVRRNMVFPLPPSLFLTFFFFSSAVRPAGAGLRRSPSTESFFQGVGTLRLRSQAISVIEKEKEDSEMSAGGSGAAKKAGTETPPREVDIRRSIAKTRAERTLRRMTKPQLNEFMAAMPKAPTAPVEVCVFAVPSFICCDPFSLLFFSLLQLSFVPQVQLLPQHQLLPLLPPPLLLLVVPLLQLRRSSNDRLQLPNSARERSSSTLRRSSPDLASYSIWKIAERNSPRLFADSPIAPILLHATNKDCMLHEYLLLLLFIDFFFSTPLHEACEAHAVHAVLELIRLKAPVTLRAAGGNTPLHLLFRSTKWQEFKARRFFYLHFFSYIS